MDAIDVGHEFAEFLLGIFENAGLKPIPRDHGRVGDVALQLAGLLQPHIVRAAPGIDSQDRGHVR